MSAADRKNAFPWINAVKSIGIYLVVLGHLWYESNLPIINQLIYSFHMPLFFILSGYLYRYKESISNIEFIKQKFFRTALPAIIWYIITGPIYIWSNRDKGIGKIILKFLFVDGNVPFNDPCWFFLVLFMVFVIVRFIRIDKNSTMINSVIILSAFIIGGLLYYFNVPDYFGLVKTIISLGFFMIGYVSRNSARITSLSEVKITRIIVIPVSMILWIVSGAVLNEKVSFAGMKLGNYWCFILSGITGTLFLYSLIRAVYRHKGAFFSALEKYPVKASIFIICSHYVPLKFYSAVCKKMDLFYTWKYNVITPFFALILIILYYPFYIFVSKHLSILNGEKKSESRKLS